MKYLLFEQSSILRKFMVIFFLISIIPLALLFYIYFQVLVDMKTGIAVETIQAALFWVVLGIGAGFFAMRMSLKEFTRVINMGKEIMSAGGVDKAVGQGGESNEIMTLTRTFNAIKAHLEEDLHRLELTKQNLHAVLTKVSIGIATAIDLDRFLRLIVETLTPSLFSSKGVVFLINKDTKEFYIKAGYGIDFPHYRGMKFPADDPFLSRPVQDRYVLAVPTITPDTLKRFPFLQAPAVCAPLLSDDQVKGVIVLCGRDMDGPFQEDELKLIQSVASQTAMAIHNEELKFLVNLDPLTELSNVRHMASCLDYEINRARRYGDALTFLMIDIDNFKDYNDALGHIEGDQLLKDIARTLRLQLRNTDIICRYGGDEFAVIMPHTDLAGVHIVAERIKAKIQEVISGKGITLSMGAAEWSKDVDRLALIAQADKALYQAKEQGKNRIVAN